MFIEQQFILGGETGALFTINMLTDNSTLKLLLIMLIYLLDM